MQLYVVRSKTDKTKGEEKKRYYGVPIVSGQITEEELATEICERCSLTRGDVLAAISALSDSMQNHLSNGYNVKLKGIGLFSVSGSSEGVDTPEECTPGKMKAQRICFKADNTLRIVLEKLKYKLTHRNKTK
ncbi:HU family DNA-binding protein [Bacteroides sp. 224]|uniref:HU family DNA-binding protein n=1 Tax=Bacteroides sp. 224 TaxID=2302936 RepID=UPI0013D34B1D|nr:HU family DNA-binding protein [Bacteroides sp. 224]NDV65975.1 hypothetical protein [Bacteroides sp. 224]